jgi:hypothetical protein
MALPHSGPSSWPARLPRSLASIAFPRTAIRTGSDFGIFELDSEKLYWKIGYYARRLKFGSEDPSDPNKTTRVMTVMLAEEYWGGHAMTEQLAFVQIVREAEERERRRRDDLRAKVQAWFDGLSPVQKDHLAEWMRGAEFDTCVALSAAAGDWYQSTRNRGWAPTWDEVRNPDERQAGLRKAGFFISKRVFYWIYA